MLGKTGGGHRPFTTIINNVGDMFLGKFRESYQNLMDKLQNGEKINDSQKQFMDRYERNLEFYKPKLARTELTGKDGSNLTLFHAIDRSRPSTAEVVGKQPIAIYKRGLASGTAEDERKLLESAYNRLDG